MNCPLCNKQCKLDQVFAEGQTPDYEQYRCICNESNPSKQWITFRVDQKRQIYLTRIYIDKLVLISFVGTEIYPVNNFSDCLYYSAETLPPLEALNLLKRFKNLIAFS